MTDLRAAAERVISAGTIYTGPVARQQDAHWQGDPDDAIAVAKAYLELVQSVQNSGDSHVGVKRD